MKRLRIAVTKGRLLEDSLALFEQAGLDCTEVRADTRKLILPIANYPMDVVLSKAALHGIEQIRRRIHVNEHAIRHGPMQPLQVFQIGRASCRERV